ncbi:hypothetical protein CUMW_173070 [Citrus unshiu]|uniref:Uncharacterized protein n=1 Tax=Citrus unshiu TaxID=55188 RepID=A0A2H5PW38_CITUN|nr:hypothetical protein CUMW_173070 [Citrus unshiu]
MMRAMWRLNFKPFLEFDRDRFKCIAAPLRSCILNFCTHIYPNVT